MVEHLDDQLSCPICIEICANAVETACCTQLLGENCSLGLEFCPVCRHEPFTVNINKSIRRVIGSMPVQCQCGVKTTRAGLKAHESICPMKPKACNVPNCGYSGLSETFLEHALEHHSKELISHFTASDDSPPLRDCIGTKGCARIGSSGKYYCGQRFNVICSCCNGACGPDDGCNCEKCMLLDIEARALPKGYLVNKEGRISREGKGSMWHCGARVIKGVFRSDDWCGPTNGPQCSACKRLQSQLNNRYASIVASWARP